MLFFQIFCVGKCTHFFKVVSNKQFTYHSTLYNSHNQIPASGEDNP